MQNPLTSYPQFWAAKQSGGLNCCMGKTSNPPTQLRFPKIRVDRFVLSDGQKPAGERIDCQRKCVE